MAKKDSTKQAEQASAKASQPAKKDSPSHESQVEKTQVSQNDGGEATHGTAKEGSESPLHNTDSVPQNEKTEVETTEPTNDVAKEADEARTEDEFKFSDESNPNQKARNASAKDAYDQDGNPRTGGYSYGVAPDDTKGTVEEESNKGRKPSEDDTFQPVLAEQNGVGLNSDQNNEEWSVEDQRKLEKQLSSPKDGIVARVTTSVGNYVRVKFFRNNKPLGTYRSKDFKAQDAKKHLKNLTD